MAPMAQPSVPPLIATLYEKLGYQPGSARPVRGFREKTYNWRRLYLTRAGRSSKNLLDWQDHQPTFLNMATEFLMDHHHGVKNGEYHWPQQNQIIDGKEVPQYPRDEALELLSQVFWRQSKHEWQNRNRREDTEDEDFEPTLLEVSGQTTPSTDDYMTPLRPDKKRLRELSINESNTPSLPNAIGESLDFLSNHSASELPCDAAAVTSESTSAPVAIMTGLDVRRESEPLDIVNNSDHTGQPKTATVNASKTRTYEREPTNLKRKRVERDADHSMPPPGHYRRQPPGIPHEGSDSTRSEAQDLEFVQAPLRPQVSDPENTQGPGSTQGPAMPCQRSTHRPFDPRFQRSQTVPNSTIWPVSTSDQVRGGSEDLLSPQKQGQPISDPPTHLKGASHRVSDGPKFHITYIVVTKQSPRSSIHVWRDGRLSNRSVENLFEEVGNYVGLSSIQEIKFILQGKLKDYNFVVHRQDKEAYEEMQAFLNKVIKREMRENQPPYDFDMDLVIEKPTRPEEKNPKEGRIEEAASVPERDVDGNL